MLTSSTRERTASRRQSFRRSLTRFTAARLRYRFFPDGIFFSVKRTRCWTTCGGGMGQRCGGDCSGRRPSAPGHISQTAACAPSSPGFSSSCRRSRSRLRSRAGSTPLFLFAPSVRTSCAEPSGGARNRSINRSRSVTWTTGAATSVARRWQSFRVPGHPGSTSGQPWFVLEVACMFDTTK